MQIQPKDQVGISVTDEPADCQMTLKVGKKAGSSPLAYKVSDQLR
jgi:hypothetical protein